MRALKNSSDYRVDRNLAMQTAKSSYFDTTGLATIVLFKLFHYNQAWYWSYRTIQKNWAIFIHGKKKLARCTISDGSFSAGNAQKVYSNRKTMQCVSVILWFSSQCHSLCPLTFFSGVAIQKSYRYKRCFVPILDFRGKSGFLNFDAAELPPSSYLSFSITTKHDTNLNEL